jgi:NAD(P) transhydrogenase subunit alpha
MEALIGALTIFVLAVFIGYEVITKVPPTLHTPLMSGSNAISGITIIGAILCCIGADKGGFFSNFLGFLAIVLAMINIVGGFMVTDRMLNMFKKKKD